MRWCAGIWRRWDVREGRTWLLFFEFAFAFYVRERFAVGRTVADLLLSESLLLTKFRSTILKEKVRKKLYKNILSSSHLKPHLASSAWNDKKFLRISASCKMHSIIEFDLFYSCPVGGCHTAENLIKIGMHERCQKRNGAF